MKIRKAVIPVAGKGTRFLPATKEIPKEMIPILDKPMIHYAVEEAVLSGVEQVIFVTSTRKETIENYFDRNFDLESFLEQVGKEKLLSQIKDIGSMIEVCTIRQKKQLGLGHAVLCAESIVGKEDFAVILGDDLVHSPTPATKQLIEVYEAQSCRSVIGVMEVDRADTKKYGIVDGAFLENDNRTMLMETMVEKPEPDQAPSLLASPGRYVLTSEIFDCLREIPRGVGGEYQLTDAINLLASKESVYAHRFIGDRFDTGNVPSYLNAVVEFALRDKRYSEVMKKIILEKKIKLEK